MHNIHLQAPLPTTAFGFEMVPHRDGLGTWPSPLQWFDPPSLSPLALSLSLSPSFSLSFSFTFSFSFSLSLHFHFHFLSLSLKGTQSPVRPRELPRHGKTTLYM